MEPNKQSTQPATDDEQSLYRPEVVADSAQLESTPTPAVKWQASEFIHHEKGTMWTVSLVVIVVVAVTIAILFRAWTFAALLVVMGVCFGILAFRQPRTVSYELDENGLHIEEQYFKLSEFKAFGVVPEEAILSIVLIPVKRFLPPVTIYFAEEDGEAIIDILGAHLPVQEMRPNPIDLLMRRLRF